MTFVVFHGSFGSPKENWFPYLAENLRSIGQEVIIPQMPTENYEEFEKLGTKAVAKNQNLNNWLKTFEKILPKLKDKRLCFVGHSIGCVFILHAVNKFNLQLDSAIFVAPFLDKLNPELIPFNIVNDSFYYDKFNFTKLKKLIPLSYAVYSDNDPYVDIKQSLKFADKMNCQKIIHRGGGHLGDIFYQGFHLIEELCKTRIESLD